MEPLFSSRSCLHDVNALKLPLLSRVYVDALRKVHVEQRRPTLEQRNKLPLLLIAFYPKSRVPDRHKVLVTIGAIPPRGLVR
jgi:hypothetical protein